ncbi:MAG: Ribosomal protein [Candidatus Parcubacteria bacterium]|jgi:large subunit ribosomal protein L34
MAIVYKTKNRKRARAHGFLARKSTPTGRAVITRRRHKGRKKLLKV